jgi:hypothetical protein
LEEEDAAAADVRGPSSMPVTIAVSEGSLCRLCWTDEDGTQHEVCCITQSLSVSSLLMLTLPKLQTTASLLRKFASASKSHSERDMSTLLTLPRNTRNDSAARRKKQAQELLGAFYRQTRVGTSVTAGNGWKNDQVALMLIAKGCPRGAARGVTPEILGKRIPKSKTKNRKVF